MNLSGKIAGIPVTVIGAVLGLVVVAALYFQTSRKSIAAADASQLTAYPELGNAGIANGDEVGEEDAAQFTSNTTWLATAVAWAVTSQGKSPLAVQQALSAYLGGDALTYEQGQIVDAVLTRFGLPPQGVDGISAVGAKTAVVTPPVTTPTATPNPVFVDPVQDFVSIVNQGSTYGNTSQGSSAWTSTGTDYSNGVKVVQMGGSTAVTYTGLNGLPDYLSDRQINALRNPGSDNGAFNGGSGTYAEREAAARKALQSIGML